MYAVCVTFHVHPDAVAQFLPRMHQQARDSLSKEVGCHQFDVCMDESNPGKVFLYEIYENQAAFELHSVSDHFLSFASDVADYVVGKEVDTYSTVAIGGELSPDS